MTILPLQWKSRHLKRQPVYRNNALIPVLSMTVQSSQWGCLHSGMVTFTSVWGETDLVRDTLQLVLHTGYGRVQLKWGSATHRWWPITTPCKWLEHDSTAGNELAWKYMAEHSSGGLRYDYEGILPNGPYLPWVSMAGRALLAGYHRLVIGINSSEGWFNIKILSHWPLGNVAVI